MTMHEVARLAKVSTATVSRTIHRIPTVDPAIAKRVWRVIKQVGYYPNTNARALVSGHSRIFGLMVPDIIDPFFPPIVQTFMELGVEHNYEVLLSFLAQDSGRLEIAVRQMIERRVDGVAILTFGREETLIDIFTCRNVPVFVVDADSPKPLLKTLQVDYQHGLREAVQHLAALGHVRIAFVSGPSHLKSALMRKSAFQECMKEIGLDVPSHLLVEGNHTIEAGIKAMSILTQLPDRPSAVVCSNDMTAIGMMRKTFDLGLDIPRDMSVVGLDDIGLAQLMNPPLTTIQFSQVEIANIAFRALLESIESPSNERSRQLYALKTNLMLRRTTAMAPDRLKELAAAKQRMSGLGSEGLQNEYRSPLCCREG